MLLNSRNIFCFRLLFPIIQRMFDIFQYRIKWDLRQPVTNSSIFRNSSLLGLKV